MTLLNKKQERKELQKGFSLVEIIVVLTIIGGIMTLLAPRIFENKGKANMKTARIQIAKIENAINAFYADCDQLPESLDQLMEDPGSDVCESWGPDPYAKSKELRDPWKNDFEYELSGSKFVIKSLGADGSEGGEGYDADITSED